MDMALLLFFSIKADRSFWYKEKIVPHCTAFMPIRQPEDAVFRHVATPADQQTPARTCCTHARSLLMHLA